MTVRRWPDTLPGLSYPSLGVTPVDPNIRTNMEVGATRVRSRTRARLDRVNVEWRMTDLQFTAFRAWFEDAFYSLVGASDDLSAWSLTNVTRSAGAAISVEGLAVDRLLETSASGFHRAFFNLSTAALDSRTISLTAAFKAAGRSNARLSLLDRAGVIKSINVDLAAGTLSGATGILSQSIKSLGGGWYRVGLTADTGIGGGTPAMRVQILDDVGTASYVGDTSKGVDICDVQARLATGYDLFLPTAADGTVLGASDGEGWFNHVVATGGGLVSREARFVSMWNARTTSALIRMVTGELEVRNA